MHHELRGRQPRPAVELHNVELAFRHLSTPQLWRACFLFGMLRFGWLVQAGMWLVQLALRLHLPVAWLIKNTLFQHFCGGETLDECRRLAKRLEANGVGSLLDYAVEGKQNEEEWQAACTAVLRTIETARDFARPFAVFKLTGLARFALLEKLSHVGTPEALTADEQAEWRRVEERVVRLCEAGARLQVQVLIDAEESWITQAVDALAISMMKRFNRDKAVVSMTVQMYRVGRLAYLQELHALAKREHFVLGVKLVRGAYLEKERARAAALQLPSPVHATKAATDHDYDEALRFCLQEVQSMALFAGTHNEASTALLVELVDNAGLERHDQRVVASQLLGMSDHLTFNLAHHGFNTVKFVPFGPVADTIPYLFRRAAENSSIQSQSGREFSLLISEWQRRRRLRRLG